MARVPQAAERAQCQMAVRTAWRLGCRAGSALVVLALGLALLAPSSAFAAFKRPLIRQLESLPAGSLEVAADGAGDLWVDEARERLVEFNAAGTVIKTFAAPGQAGEGLAINWLSGDVYVPSAERVEGEETYYLDVYDAAGTLLGRVGPLAGKPGAIAIDNSRDPLDSAVGDVYVALSEGGIERFSESGAQAPFQASGSVTYVAGNEIVGSPQEPHIGVRSIAVDSLGDVYARAVNYEFEAENGPVVVAYAPSGRFLSGLSGNGTPGVAGSHEEVQWGGTINGVAVDPASDRLLVTLDHLNGGGSTGVREGAIDEFELEHGERFGTQITEASQGELLVPTLDEGTAITSGPDGTVYYASRGLIDEFGPGRFLPSPRLGEPSQRAGSTATLNGAVDPENSQLETCRFEYVGEPEYRAEGWSKAKTAACKGPDAAEIPADSNYHEVHAAIASLTPGTVYYYRLSATTSGELGGTEATAALLFTAPEQPTVQSASTSNLSSSYADLHARIDPEGADTSYHFEYSSDSSTWTIAPAPDGEIGSGGATGSEAGSVEQQIGPLQPATSYRFRVLAKNAFGLAPPGPQAEGVFTTLPAVAAGLPDNRAYELVTPVDKGAAEDLFAGASLNGEFTNPNVGYASESGDEFVLETYSRFGPFPAAERGAYLFSRSLVGWTNTSLASPTLGVQDLESMVFDTSDPSQVAINEFVGSRSSVAGAAMTTLLGPAGGPYVTVHADSPVHTEAEYTEETEFEGASRDLSTVVLESKNHALAPGASGQDDGSDALYEYSGGELQLVNVNNEGSLLNRCGAVLGLSHNAGARYGAVSADGSRILFTSPDPYASGTECWDGANTNSPQLYLRSGASTIEVSAAEKGFVDPSCSPHRTPCYPAYYVGASEDDSRIFFVTRGWLTASHPAVHDLELYEYDTESGRLTRISAGEEGSPGATAGAEVFAVPAVSGNGSAVYFLARGRLTGNAPATSAPLLDLYRYDTATASTTYVATVEDNDYPVTAISGWAGSAGLALSPTLSWYTTPDGRYLLFATDTEPTGYSNDEAKPGECPRLGGAAAKGHCREIYRYDADTGGLACISCDPSGQAPRSNAGFAELAGSETDPSAGPVRAISDDGAYAFFSSADPLVPQAENDTLNVYEWHEGRISLISGGESPYPSFFVGMSADASNVFFGSHANLIPWLDTESQGNLYDARICTTAEPCIEPPSTGTAKCEGGDCQHPPSAPIDETPASLAFSGPGNSLPGPAPSTVKPPPTAAQLRAKALATALKACKKDRSKKQRAACETQARKKYAPAKKAKKAKKTSNGKGRA
jgi:hypothetical protein